MLSEILSIVSFLSQATIFTLFGFLSIWWEKFSPFSFKTSDYWL